MLDLVGYAVGLFIVFSWVASHSFMGVIGTLVLGGIIGWFIPIRVVLILGVIGSLFGDK